MQQVFDTSFTHMLRLVLQLQNLASLLALTLAVIGLYSVISFQVTQRTREIGIRMALGAQQLQALNLFLRRAAAMGVIGITLGVLLLQTWVEQTSAVGMPPGS